MVMKEYLKKCIKDSYLIILLFYMVKIIILLIGERNWIKILYKIKMHKSVNLNSPELINEKIQWLKLNYYKPYYEKCCDKYLIHEYLKEKLGEDIAVPILFGCNDPNDFSLKKIKYFPCIIKISNGCGSNLIIRKKDEYSDKYIRSWIKKQIWAANFHTLWTREHQYKEKKPYIIAEKLLFDSSGEIPNDYKFFYFNGKLKFIYCSVDRMGSNVRHIYDSNWERLPFIWVKDANESIFNRYYQSKDILRPKSFDTMLRIGQKISTDFPMVRVDFYETPEGLYIGEITLHHGSGFDSFYPTDFDKKYGSELSLPERNR